ncbi:hypothetical protein K440DRAFT_618962 [Wilcoxina mikolae CBS 423.85]|nr:hypothetical protein K440DRAFT_618962 [Wilcoxina mikolae CBS 423.85]
MGSSHHKCLNVAHAAFDLLLQTITKVQSDQTNRQPPFSRSSTVSRPSSSNTPSASITAAARAHTVPSSTLAPNYSCGTASFATTASNPTPAPGRAGNTPPNSVTPDPPNESSSATAQLQKGHASLGSSATAAQSLPDLIETRVSWTYGTDKCAFNFRNMGEIIAVMAPLQLTSPVVALMISDIVNMIILSLVKSDPSASVVQYCESKFKASFCMSTAEYQGPSPGTIDYSASSLSQGLMTRDKLLAAERTTQIQGTQLPMVAEDSQRRRRKEEEMIQARKEEIENANRIMKQWEFYEKGVMVSCGRYVWTVIIICTILVIGGIVIGLTVHDRVKAVDPFNITTYLWVLAAFIILVAKSVRVENWPWRDFLLRRVFCRSVTELHAVSGIDPQLILAKLLNDEKSTMLQTRGPHNSPFKRKSEDGFSIDEPLSMWTMLMSGLIMVKVATPQGEALVCLDVRMGTNIAMIRELNLPTDKKEYLCCNKSIPQDVVKGTQQRLPVTQTQLQWYRIIGLFNCRNCVFV